MLDKICSSAVAAATCLILTATAEVNAEDTSYAKASSGTRVLTLETGTEIKVLYDSVNLGGSEADVASFSFPPGTRQGGGHLHGAVEIFYVVSGVLVHTVNGEEHVLSPGMAGLVRPGDTVQHGVEGPDPATGLIIWVPGGEAARLAESGIFAVTAIQ